MKKHTRSVAVLYQHSPKPDRNDSYCMDPWSLVLSIKWQHYGIPEISEKISSREKWFVMQMLMPSLLKCSHLPPGQQQQSLPSFHLHSGDNQTLRTQKEAGRGERPPAAHFRCILCRPVGHFMDRCGTLLSTTCICMIPNNKGFLSDNSTFSFFWLLSTQLRVYNPLKLRIQFSQSLLVVANL